jgi:hypothetical protein
MSELIGAGAPEGVAEPELKRKGRGRNFRIVAVAVLAGLLLGGAALFFLAPDGSPEALAPIPKGKPPAGGAKTPTATPSATPEEGKETQSNRKLTSRDPFAPLISPSQAPASDDSGSDAGSADEPAATAATGATISALTISAAGDSVKLKLDGKKYDVEEGETFAKSYRLYDIFNSNCAGFLYGDANAVVCEGDEVSIG